MRFDYPMKHIIFAGNWYYDIQLFLEKAQDGDVIESPHPLIMKFAQNEKERLCPDKKLELTVTPRIPYRNVLPYWER